MAELQPHSFRALAGELKNPQALLSFIEKSPILQSMPMQESNKGLSHIREILTYSDSLKPINFDGAMEDMNASSRFETINLQMYAGTMHVPQHTAKETIGGKMKYFEDRLATIVPKTGVDFEKEILRQLKEFSILNGNVIDGLGSSNKNFTIYGVNWELNNTHGLYNPAMKNTATGFKVEMLYDGALMQLPAQYGGAYGYGAQVESTWGLNLSDKRKVGIIKNVDLVTSKSTILDLISELLLNIRAESKTTKLYMHPAAIALLRNFKTDRLVLDSSVTNIDTKVLFFDGVELLPSYNLPWGTEPNA